MNITSKFSKYTVASLCFLGLAACHPDAKPKAGPGHYEYASFYAEVAGDFADPVDSEAPARYSWTDRNESVNSGNISKIWKVLGVNGRLRGESMGEIEVIVINHLAQKGWVLHHFANFSVQSPRQDLQTMYRYIFRRLR
ncbi:MAG: hypothetical protein VYA34_04100 [Myxococcota bacterium]|nr:hypothetical protein [Myxococcota bacterium]